jgi:hypothetical protein
MNTATLAPVCGGVLIVMMVLGGFAGLLLIVRSVELHHADAPTNSPPLSPGHRRLLATAVDAIVQFFMNWP